MNNNNNNMNNNNMNNNNMNMNFFTYRAYLNFQ
jgi:hypothetical protein